MFTSDHGDWMGDNGLWQKGAVHTHGVTRIPWIVRWPGVSEPGRQVSSVASHVDLVPTLLDAAGVDIPYAVQGESLRPVLTGEREALRPFALIEHRHEETDSVDPSPGDIYLRTVVTDRYRYSHYSGLAEGEYAQLHDLDADPDERHNLWGEDPDLLRDMQSVMIEALLHAQDPLPEREAGVGA